MDNYHVVPKDNTWVLHEEGGAQAIQQARTKDEMLTLLSGYFAETKASVKIHRADFD